MSLCSHWGENQCVNYGKLTLGKGTQCQVLPSKCCHFLVVSFHVGQSYSLPSEPSSISLLGTVALQLWCCMPPPFLQDRLWLRAEAAVVPNRDCIHRSNGVLDPIDRSRGGVSSYQEVADYEWHSALSSWAVDAQLCQVVGKVFVERGNAVWMQELVHINPTLVPEQDSLLDHVSLTLLLCFLFCSRPFSGCLREAAWLGVWSFMRDRI